jgi:hypothetical protein
MSLGEINRASVIITTHCRARATALAPRFFVRSRSGEGVFDPQSGLLTRGAQCDATDSRQSRCSAADVPADPQYRFCDA